MIDRSQLLDNVEQLVLDNAKKLNGPNSDHGHPWRVAAKAATTDERIVALLHDELEEGFATVDELKAISVPSKLIRSILILTRDKSMSYQEYIDKICGSKDEVAINVKIYDIFDHLSPHRVKTLGSKLDRYIKALKKLVEARQRMLS